MDIPQDLLYTKTHEWVKVEGKIAKVGITDYAQHEITDVVHVELPNTGKAVKAGGMAAVVESVKSAFDIYSPVGGTITEVNEAVLSNPELVNSDPYGKGFLFSVEIADTAELASLLKDEDYKNTL
jgi:glycine cleavage system H protein